MLTEVVPCVLRSFKRAKQPGGFTRLLSCTKEQLKNYRGLDLVPTHVVPSLTMDPNKEHNDHYSAYNKPGAVLFWLRVIMIQHIFAKTSFTETLVVTTSSSTSKCDEDICIVPIIFLVLRTWSQRQTIFW